MLFRINRTMAAAVSLCGLLLAPAMANAGTLAVKAATLRPIAKADPRFQSYNVEMAEIVGGRFWAPYPKAGASSPQNTLPSGGLDLAANMFRQREPLDLKNTRLRNLATALGPAYIRVSGSWANTVYFQDDDQPRLQKPPPGFQNVLTRAEWAGVVDFARNVNARIVTSFAVSAGTRDPNGRWNPEQARKLIDYTRALGGEIYAAELINEPNIAAVSGLPGGYSPADFARDIADFHALIASDDPAMKAVGPGSTGEAGVSQIVKRGIPTDKLLSAEPKPQFDIFSYHFYGASSQRCSSVDKKAGISPDDALSEPWLARTDKTFDYYKVLRDRYTAGAPIWVTETAEASCGGDRWASTFLDSFRYIDQMGRLSARGVAAIFHNTLAASDYALIDDTTWMPRPDYWAALLWRRLMGDIVLDAGPSGPELHVYAHCLLDRPGGVGVVAINLNRSASVTLKLPVAAERYTLSAENLQSGSVQLNGRTLAMSGDQLPRLSPVNVPKGAIRVQPATIVFLALPGASNPACH